MLDELVRLPEEERDAAFEQLPESASQLLKKAHAAHNTAFLQTLAIVHQTGANPEHIELLRKHHSSREDDIVRLLWWSDKPLSGEAQRWLANLRCEAQPGSGALHGSPLASRPDPEYPVMMELLAAVRAELVADVTHGSKPPDYHRLTTVLSVVNRRGRSVANHVIDDIATDLKADVIHLDAFSLARLLGTQLQQNIHNVRGSVSMLGYAASEINGRLANRDDADSDGDVGVLHVSMPSKLRSFLSSGKDFGTSRSVDPRWEGLKIQNTLKAIVRAADAKRFAQTGSYEKRDLIIHLHDYVEISELQESLMTRLRDIVDDWHFEEAAQDGKKIVLVGSSSSDMEKSQHWRNHLVELGREGHHIIPFHASPSTEWMDRKDNLYDNINNIKSMLEARLLTPAAIDFDAQIKFQDDQVLVDERYTDLFQTLSKHVFDVQWVYRLTSLLLGSRSPPPKKYGLGHLKYALAFMSDRDNHWKGIYSGIRPPYFSPLFRQKGGGSSSNMFDQPTPDGGDSPTSGFASSWSNQSQNNGDNKDYDQHEKKLLAGLVNAKDIHTTFDDIIVPAETKESLIGLTSLSLQRPDAFAYGVLKTERIPGCLLYGPPGTGKTLLAKAVAKESGANMLEVSAASINDMWLGQSEKNVRALFSLARKLSPMVIFLDEADALLGARHNNPGRTAHRETITQFLREWDGLSDMRAFIMVATNRPFDLDEAVLRRLPRKILVDLPLVAERAKILRVMLREEQLSPDVDLDALAKETDLYSGSDLKNLCVSAAMEAVREECRAKEAHDAANPDGDGGPPYEFPEKRVLTRKHFEKGMREISASISEDMESLKAIRKFDEQYGDAGGKAARKKGRRGMGFEVAGMGKGGTEEARVRKVVVDEDGRGKIAV
ncbi:P-loop containing nucleoside triphosphate hydrolase protein [Sordaria sp. MPI-SDFR-AT-0083]|nr:P-loop containing nucleoside triphosphate hydrolase protein [Sordaria sp. MPI-SDFR-AT-0083]